MAITIVSQVGNVQNNCGNIGICNRATELVYHLLHMQLNDMTKYCTGICFIPSLHNVR